MRKQCVPKKTAAHTGWAVRVSADWVKQPLAKPFVDEEEAVKRKQIFNVGRPGNGMKKHEIFGFLSLF